MATRRERVVLELEDNFTSPMARAAAATALLDKNLKGLDGSTTKTSRSTQAMSRDVDKVGTSARRSGSEIDRFSGRLRLIADAAAVLGPGLVPIGAVGIPAVAGLAAQMGAAALATGTAVLAFQGVGDTLKAVNDASLEPSAENLEKARIAMGNLSPAARSFVRELQSMRPALNGLRDAAASGLFPGLERGLEDAARVLPDVEQVMFRIGDAAGDLGADLGEALASPRGREFLAFLEREVPRALTELGHTVGNLAAGMGELWMAFTPLNRDVSGWLLDASRGFDEWASGLAETEGFRDFVAYVRESGPQVADAMASLANALVQVVEAAAPMGGPVLAGISAVADVIAAIADSNAGPAIMATVTALALLNRGMATFEAIKSSSLATNMAAGSLTKMQGAGLAAAAGIGAVVAASEAMHKIFDENLPTMNELTGQLMDLGSGDMSALPSEFDSLAGSIERITDPSLWKGQMTADTVLGALGLESRTMSNATDEIEALDAALANLVTTGGPEQARAAFDKLVESQHLTAEQARQLLELLPGYRDALAGVSNQAKQAAGGFNRGAAAAEAFHAAVEKLNSLLEGRANMRDYEQAVDDLAKTLRKAGDKARFLDKNGKINIDLPKGREVQEGLDNIASTAVRVAENLRGTQKIQVLNQARRDLIATAEKFGLPRSAIQDLLGMLRNLSNTRATPNVVLEGADTVRGSLADVSSWLNSLDGKTATTWVTTRHVNSGGMGPQAADGATVPKTGLGYADRHPYLLADGEEVISNRHGQADRHRDLLKAINANRLADGGTVSHRWHGPPARVSTSSTRVVERVVERMPGQVTLSIPGMGNLVAQVADSRIDADHQFRRRLDDRD